MRQHPHLVHPRQQQHFVGQKMQPQTSLGSAGGIGSGIVGSGGGGVGGGGGIGHHHSIAVDDSKKHKRTLGAPYISHERSYSSSEEDLRSTPEFEGRWKAFFLITFMI